MHKDGLSKLIVLHVLVATTIGFTCAAAVIHHRRRRKSSKPISKPHQSIVPLLNRSESGHVAKLEKFSHYAARQIGFKDGSGCPELCKLADEYMKNSKGCKDRIYEYFSNEENPESLYVKLVEEFERCILSYLAFHWSQASFLVTQVLSAESGDQKKLKNLVMAATRKQRFAKVAKDLKVKRTITTLVEEMKLIGCNVVKGDEACTEVMVPVAHSDRSPVLLFMGGGMGAGKSTVLKDILKESFWSGAAAKAVVVEADAFKETDVIYRAISSHGHHQDMLQTAELVHQTSTDAASSLLVTALNEGRDVIMDGTLSWEPFFHQTVAMARNVHKHRYRMGFGYKVLEDGTIFENYWEQVVEDDQEKDATDNPSVNRKPYRIELVGVVCDAYLAVARGIRRAIGIKRAVRVKSQLKSHKNFARAFPSYCQLVDNARLYCTSAIGTPPKLIGWKDGHRNLLIDEEEIKCLKAVSDLNDEAESIYELYKDQNRILEPGSVWKEMVLSPTRASLQRELKTVIQKIEKTTTE